MMNDRALYVPAPLTAVQVSVTSPFTSGLGVAIRPLETAGACGIEGAFALGYTNGNGSVSPVVPLI